MALKQVGILGRQKPLFIRAEQICFQYKIHTLGTTWDQEMDLWIKQKRIEILIIDSTVEKSSVIHFENSCKSALIPILYVDGLENLNAIFNQVNAL
jgi:hypothetical protein